MKTNESGTTFIFATGLNGTGFDLSANTKLTLVFTLPDGSTLTVTSPAVALGGAPLTVPGGTINAHQYVSYVLQPNQVQLGGTWKVQLIYDQSTASPPLHLSSATQSFTVAAVVVSPIQAPIPPVPVVVRVPMAAVSANTGTRNMGVNIVNPGNISVPLVGVGTSASAGATSGNTGSAILTRTITNLAGTSLPATAFWHLGQPFKPGEVPAGSIARAALNGVSIPSTGIVQKYHADGSLARSEFIIDFSGVSLAAGANQTLSFPIVAGSWVNTTSRTNADWEGLLDTVELTNLTTTSTSHPDMDKAGTWIAAFDGGATNTIEVVGQGPQGLYVNVKADFVNTGTTHAYLRARMEYLVCQKADTSLGPIAWRGPFIENVQVMKSNGFAVDPGLFTYDLNWKRNGVSQRSQLQVSNVGATSAQMCRYDGQWEWTGTDPKIGVTQDYTLTRKTLKIPPFLSGITYTGADNSSPNTPVAGINTSTGVFTVGSVYTFFGLVNSPVAIGFTAVSMPAGLSGDPAVYWASYVSNSTFALYDSYAHAAAGGSTGKVIPSTSGTSVVLRLSVAPMTPGCYQQYMPAGGARNDISLLSEWGSAYHVGNTPDFQRLARVMAYAKSGIQTGIFDATTGKIPNFGNTSITGLGTPLPFATPGTGTGGSNNWSQDGGHFPGAVNYAVWLMEGGTFLRDTLLFEGNMGIWQAAYFPQRNISISGTTYYASCMFVFSGTSARYGAWFTRALAYAAFAAPNGSPEETYYRGVMSDNCAEWEAYVAYKGGNFGLTGAIVYDEDDYPPAGHYLRAESIVFEGFMQSYMGIATATAALLHGDYVSGLNTVATFSAKFNTQFYNSSFPSYFGTAYSMSQFLNDDPTISPGTYIASFNELGLGATDNMFFNFTSGNPAIAWQTQPPPWTLLTGDKYRPTNYPCLSTGIGANPSPSPFVDNTDYTITAVTSTTFSTGTTPGASVVGVGGFFLPTGQGNPASSTLVGGLGADSYLMYQVAGLGLQSVFGATGASAAWTNAYSRFAGSPSSFANQCMWAFQDTV